MERTRIRPASVLKSKVHRDLPAVAGAGSPA